VKRFEMVLSFRPQAKARRMLGEKSWNRE